MNVTYIIVFRKSKLRFSLLKYWIITINKECLLIYLFVYSKLLEMMSIFKSFDYNEVVELCDRIIYSITFKFRSR